MCKFGSRESVKMGERLNNSAVKFNEKVSKLKLLLNQLYTKYRYHCLLVSVVERIEILNLCLLMAAMPIHWIPVLERVYLVSASL